MVHQPQWPHSCAKLYAGIARAMKDANKEHQEENEGTYLHVNFVRVRQGTRVFQMKARIDFCSTTTLDQRQRYMRILNTVNETIMNRKVAIDIIQGPDTKHLGNPVNPIQVTYQVVDPSYDGGHFVSSLVYSDDTESYDRGITWDSGLAGKHIMDFLIKGILDGQDFPSQFMP